jgi:ribose transport system substrate-binding protein
MTSTRHADGAATRKVRARWLAVLLAGLCAAATACGSASSSSAAGGSASVGSSGTSGTSGAGSAELQQYSGSFAPKAPGAAFDASADSGKTVWLVPYVTTDAFAATIDSAFVAALKHEGVHVVTCDAQGNPADNSACINEAVAHKASAIQVDASDPSTYASGIAAAKKAGIPIATGDDSDPTVALPGVDANVAPPYVLEGKLAAMSVLNGDPHADVLFITVPDITGAQQEESGFDQEFKQLCPGCTLQTKGVTIADWATDLGPTTSAALTADPNIDNVVLGFDSMAAFSDPAISQLGKASKVKVTTFDGSLEQMIDIKNSDVVSTEIGVSVLGLGDLQANEILRLMAGKPAVDVGQDVPIRVFDQANVGSLALTPAAYSAGSWYSSEAAYNNLFYQLWK